MTQLRQRLAGLSMLLAVALPCQAMAETLAGATMPDTMTVQGSTLHLNGMGLRTFTFLQIHGYVAGLYLTSPAHTEAAILASPGLKLLQIRYLHGAGIGRVQEEFREGRRVNCAAGCPPSEDQSFAQLYQTARAVKAGDTTTYIYGPTGVEVLFNDKSLAMIKDPDFGRRMLDSMIGAHPPSVSLRDGLLGG